MKDIEPLIGHNSLMARVHRLFIGEWFDALGMKPADCARETGIGAPYLSLLIAHKRENPSPQMRDQIADFLGIHWTKLYEPPPDAEFLAKLRTIDPKTLNRLK